ncbi:MAG: tetratricopeptide repeat protein [Methylovulum sp.]|nr:tetratricopeptide repeat protein [Methylovulum sp.]
MTVPTQEPCPSPAQTCFQQGRQERLNGNVTAAITCFQEAIRLQADFIPAYNNLGNLLQAQGQITAAIAVYQQALALAPDMAVLHCNHASLRQIQGEHELAIAGYQQALRLKPDFFTAHHNLGKVLASQGRPKQAVEAFHHALRLKPDAGEAHLDLGHAYRQQGLADSAINSFKMAIRCLPGSAHAYNSLGAMLQQRGEVKMALAAYRRALKLNPDYDTAHYNLGLLLDELGELEAAQEHYERSLALQPSATNVLYHLEYLRLKLADWDDYEQRLAMLITRTESYLKQGQDTPLPAMILMAFPAPIGLQTALASQLAKFHARTVAPLQADLPAVPKDDAPKRLRIGYVSPDFRCHAVGTLIHQMFQYHQRPEFEIFAYSLAPVADAWTETIRHGCDHFAEMAYLSPLTIAQRIQADGIHILIDLAGYTSHSLTALFALRPAPVQLQYLGYPGTMGADFIPYILADKTLIPADLTQHYSEQVIYLPHAWVSAPMDIAAPTLSRADYGLPEDATVYCSFNAVYKINPDVFQVWLRILQQVPGSVLWLADGGRPIIAGRLRKQAADRNIAPERLVFTATLPHDEYLACYRLADLFLDTFIYNAGATAVGALWAGLPVLTCPGATYASRMGAALCNAVGLPELICMSASAYEQQAIAWGNNPGQLLAIKAKLAQALIAAPLFQPQLFIRELESALRQLWQAAATKNNAPSSCTG